MQSPSDTVAAWRQRAAQNLRAGTLLAARHPPLWHPAVSRIYYACYQAAVAKLRQHGQAVGDSHGELWRAAEAWRWGLGNAIWALYKWRRRADYATAEIGPDKARELVAEYAALCRSLDIHEETP